MNPEVIAKTISFLLFLAIGFAAVPFMIRFVLVNFNRIQSRLGNQRLPLIQFLVTNEQKIIRRLTYAYWLVYLLGLLIASPYIIQMIRE